MPLVKIHTTLDLDKGQTNGLLQNVSAQISDLLGKPESYVMTLFEKQQAMTFAGTPEPSCFIEVKSIGTMTPEQTKSISNALCSTLEKDFEIPASRTYIEFNNAERHLWGWNNSTF